MLVVLLLGYIVYIEDKLRKQIYENDEPKSIFPEATEDNCPALPRVVPVGVTNLNDVHAIENVTLEPVNDHFDDMFQGNSAWQKGFSLDDQVI